MIYNKFIIIIFCSNAYIISYNSTGHTVKFIAEISGNPQPTIAWQFNGRPLYGSRDNKVLKHQIFKLLLSNLTCLEAVNKQISLGVSTSKCYSQTYKTVHDLCANLK